MCLLRVLDLAGELTWRGRQKVLAVGPTDFDTHCSERFVAEHCAVGTHIGDEATLIQTLRDAHHLRRAEAQLATTLLLQGARSERCLCAAAVRLVLDGSYGDRGRRQVIDERVRLVLTDDYDTLLRIAIATKVLTGGHLGPIERNQRGCKRRTSAGEELEIPISGGDKRDAFALALHNQTNGRTLHTTSRETTVDTAPQNRADLVAIQAIENAPRLSSVDQAVVDRSWIVDCVVDRGFGDLMEHHPLHGHLGFQVLEKMPTNGLTLAIFVGCEVELARIFQCRS